MEGKHKMRLEAKMIEKICKKHQQKNLCLGAEMSKDKVEKLKELFDIPDDEQISAYWSVNDEEDMQEGIAICESGLYLRGDVWSDYLPWDVYSFNSWEEDNSVCFSFDDYEESFELQGERSDLPKLIIFFNSLSECIAAQKEEMERLTFEDRKNNLKIGKDILQTLFVENAQKNLRVESDLSFEHKTKIKKEFEIPQYSQIIVFLDLGKHEDEAFGVAMCEDGVYFSPVNESTYISWNCFNLKIHEEGFPKKIAIELYEKDEIICWFQIKHKQLEFNKLKNLHRALNKLIVAEKESQLGLKVCARHICEDAVIQCTVCGCNVCQFCLDVVKSDKFIKKSAIDRCYDCAAESVKVPFSGLSSDSNTSSSTTSDNYCKDCKHCSFNPFEISANRCSQKYWPNNMIWPMDKACEKFKARF